MKILIISQYYYPEQFQINEIAPELVRRGHEVTVVCGLPNYPHGTIYAGYETKEERENKASRYREQTGVNVIYSWQVLRGKGAIKRIANYFSFPIHASRIVKKLSPDYDVILCYHVSPIMMIYPGVVYKKKHHVPMVTYNLDIWPECAQAFTKSNKGLIYKLITKMSSWLYQQNDLILVTSRPFIDYLYRADGVEVNKMKYLPQHSSSEMLDMNLNSDENGVADFLFAGNLGKGQWLDVIVKAAGVLGVRKNYMIHIVGDGSMRQELEALVKEKHLEDNFVFYGNQNRKDMPSFYKKADVLLISLRGNNEVGNTMPGKLQVYMTTGKPILGAINGAAKEVIEEAQCGRCVAAGDYEGLAELMKHYIDHPDEYSKCGKNAKEYFKNNFTLDFFITQLERELIEITNRKYNRF